MVDPTRFYDDPAYGVLQRMTMGKAADAALGSAFSAQTEFARKTFMTGVTVRDFNLEVPTGATCTGTGGMTTEVWTLKVGKSAAGTGAITAIGTATVGTAGQADGTVLDGTVTETDFSSGDDIVFYTDAGTALGDNSLVAMGLGAVHRALHQLITDNPARGGPDPVERAGPPFFTGGESVKRVFLYREGAFGDHLHMSNVIRAYHEDGWEITALYNFKGAQVHEHNPRIHHREVFESSGAFFTPKKARQLSKRLLKAYEEFDRFVSFQKSLEDARIANEGSSEYFWPLRRRRQKNAGICYYDQSMIWAGLTAERYMGRTGEVFFTSPEHEFIKAWLRKYLPPKAHFILWALRGSMYQKAVYPLAKDITTAWLERHPESWIVTTGDKFCQQWEWEHPRVIHKSGRMPFRQALQLARYADMVVTPETGLGIGAGCFSTPKIMLLTAASIENICGNDKNDYSLQSDAWCSPCTRAIYNTANCPPGRSVYNVRDEKSGEVLYEPLPLCVDFDKEVVLERMEEVYANHGLHNLSARQSGLADEPVYM